MAYSLANLSPNFSVLGDIGTAIKTGGEERKLKETLADLDASDPESLRNKANAVLKLGTPTAIDLSLKLHGAAQAREALTQKGAEAAMFQKYLTDPTVRGRIGGIVSPTPPPTPNVPPAAPAGGEALAIPEGAPALPQTLPFPAALPPAPSPATIAPTPEAPAPAPAAPPPLMPSVPVPPGQRLSEGPLTELSAQTRTAAPPPPAPPEAPAVPDVAKMLQAPPQGVPGSPLPPVGSTGVAGFGGPPTPARAPGAPAPTLPGQEQAEAKIKTILEEMAFTPKNATGARQALAKRFEAELAETKWDPKVKHWHMENLDNWRRGEPTMGYGEWTALQQLRPEMAKHAMDAAKVNYDTANKSRGLVNTIDVMEAIRSNPKFVAGPLSAGFAQGLSAVGSIRDILESSGVKGLPDITGITTKAGLIQTYNALASRLVLESLGGSLGNQISNADREFMGNIMPYLAQTKEGQKMMHEITKSIAERNITIGNLTRTYMSERKTNATREGLESAITAHADKNRLFRNADESFTPLGQRLNKLFTAESVPGERGQMSAANPFGAALRAVPAVVEGARRMFGGGQAPEAPTPITPEHEGKTGTYQGKRFKIQGGRMVFE